MEAWVDASWLALLISALFSRALCELFTCCLSEPVTTADGHPDALHKLLFKHSTPLLRALERLGPNIHPKEGNHAHVAAEQPCEGTDTAANSYLRRGYQSLTRSQQATVAMYLTRASVEFILFVGSSYFMFRGVLLDQDGYFDDYRGTDLRLCLYGLMGMYMCELLYRPGLKGVTIVHHLAGMLNFCFIVDGLSETAKMDRFYVRSGSIVGYFIFAEFPEHLAVAYYRLCSTQLAGEKAVPGLLARVTAVSSFAYYQETSFKVIHLATLVAYYIYHFYSYSLTARLLLAISSFFWFPAQVRPL
jgi:hypothetical protein